MSDLKTEVDEYTVDMTREAMYAWRHSGPVCTSPVYELSFRVSPEQAKALSTPGAKVYIEVPSLRDRQIAAAYDVLTHRKLPPRKLSKVLVDAVTGVK